MNPDPVAPFKDAIQTSRHRLSALSDAGEKIFGYFCTYTPAEALHAAGFVPVRITGGYGLVEKAFQHVPDFICPYMKRALEKSLTGHYDFLSGLVQGYSCDAACGMVNIWKETAKIEPVHSVPLPYNDSLESKKFLAAAFDELIETLNTAGGCFSLSALSDSLDLHEKIRSLQYRLYQKQYNGASGFSAADFMTIMDAGGVTKPEDYLVMLQKLTQGLTRQIQSLPAGVPVLVSGSIVERPTIMDMIASAGGRVAADDLCNGLRQILPVAGDGKTPMDRLIHRTLHRFPCPSRSRAVDRSRRLLDILHQSRAKGVIFIVQKFCTPHLADIPMLSDILKHNGFPCLTVEMDETWEMAGQVRTRLEGFFEMIG